MDSTLWIGVLWWVGMLGSDGNLPCIRAVAADSPAARAGLHSGDCIARVDDEVIADLDGFQRALDRKRVGQPVRFQLRRDAENANVKEVVVVPKAPPPDVVSIMCEAGKSVPALYAYVDGSDRRVDVPISAPVATIDELARRLSLSDDDEISVTGRIDVCRPDSAGVAADGPVRELRGTKLGAGSIVLVETRKAPPRNAGGAALLEPRKTGLAPPAKPR